MQQKTNVTFQGLELDKKAIDALDIHVVRAQKLERLKETKISLLAGIGFGVLGVLGVVDTAMSPNSFVTNMLFTTMALSIGWGRFQRKGAKELDVIEYIKTGDPGSVCYKGTQRKAEKAGYMFSFDFKNA